MDDVEFGMFDDLYPHEAYAADPDRFLAYAQGKTKASKEEIIRVLKETAQRS